MKTHRIKVAVRCRPSFDNELDEEPILDVDGYGRRVVLKVHPNKFREFGFDYVFGPSATQDNVFDGVAEPVLTEVLNKGYNGTIMAYGQTGSFKFYSSSRMLSITYSMIRFFVLRSRKALAKRIQWEYWNSLKMSTQESFLARCRGYSNMLIT
jgi:Kinesin motor domain